jgi:hypothetical protein
MKFAYTTAICGVTVDGDYLCLLRPEVPVSIVGPAGQMTLTALVDTGSDRTIFPKSVATRLQIATEIDDGPPAKAFGGHDVQLLVGEALLELKSEGESITWRSTVWFFDFPAGDDEAVVLGHAGFLDYFTATFDGLEAVLTLEPNRELPEGVLPGGVEGG